MRTRTPIRYSSPNATGYIECVLSWEVLMDDQVATRILLAKLEPPRYATRIGRCVLSTDEIGQRAFERVVPEGRASVVTTRVVYSDENGFTVIGGFKNLLDALPPE